MVVEFILFCNFSPIFVIKGVPGGPTHLGSVPGLFEGILGVFRARLFLFLETPCSEDLFKNEVGNHAHYDATLTANPLIAKN